MSKIVQILNYEEGYKERPYIDTEGYPTVACGIVIGPKDAALINYQFTVPKNVGDIWMQTMLDDKIQQMNTRPSVVAALTHCNPPRQDVLYCMAYQLGVDGLAAFKNTLVMVADSNFAGAAEGMLSSLWARQTPQRATRLAQMMRTGTYDVYLGVI